MDFDHSPRVKALQKKLGDFMAEFICPNEPTYRDQAATEDHWRPPYGPRCGGSAGPKTSPA
jgi:hypothetical protein